MTCPVAIPVFGGSYAGSLAFYLRVRGWGHAWHPREGRAGGVALPRRPAAA